MRHDAYYWKCDAPYAGGGRHGYLDPDVRDGIPGLAATIARDHFGESPLDVRPLENPGNHFTCVVTLRGRKVFFRADDGRLADDYMLAEAHAMDRVRREGVPVPEVLHTDVTLKDYPVRFQLLDFIEGEKLDLHYNDGTLSCEDVAFELGTCMAKMHRITLDGFGFLDTHRLNVDGEAVGLHASHRSYFYKRMGAHLDVLVSRDFLTAGEAERIARLLDLHSGLLDIERGSLLHKDLAFWNILGTRDTIRAIVDWDDIIVGDPMDDIAILRCFYDEEIMDPLLQGYRRVTALPGDYRLRLSFYLVRNMLWKAVIRIRMGFFDNPDTCFMIGPGQRQSAREFTYRRLLTGVEELDSGRGAVA